MTVAGDVVAGHDGERHDAIVAAPHQPGKDEAEHGLRRRSRLRVGNDVGVGRIEHARSRIDEIAAFGDGQRDDADRRVGKPFDDRRRIAGHQEIDHGTGDAGAHMAGILLDHGGQPVLLGKLAATDLLGLEDAGADQRPVVADARIEQIVEIDGLVRAMEIADAEMHDAGLERRAIVFRPGNFFRQVGEIGRRKLHDHLFTLLAGLRPSSFPLSPSFTGRR